jgi:hypothetical protein
MAGVLCKDVLLWNNLVGRRFRVRAVDPRDFHQVWVVLTQRARRMHVVLEIR